MSQGPWGGPQLSLEWKTPPPLRPPPQGPTGVPAQAAWGHSARAGDGTLLLLVRAVTLQTRTVSNNALSAAQHREHGADLGWNHPRLGGDRGPRPNGEGARGLRLPRATSQPPGRPRWTAGAPDGGEGLATTGGLCPTPGAVAPHGVRGQPAGGAAWKPGAPDSAAGSPRSGQCGEGGSAEASVKGGRAGAGEAGAGHPGPRPEPPLGSWCGSNPRWRWGSVGAPWKASWILTAEGPLAWAPCQAGAMDSDWDPEARGRGYREQEARPCPLPPLSLQECRYGPAIGSVA